MEIQTAIWLRKGLSTVEFVPDRFIAYTKWPYTEGESWFGSRTFYLVTKINFDKDVRRCICMLHLFRACSLHLPLRPAKECKQSNCSFPHVYHLDRHRSNGCKHSNCLRFTRLYPVVDRTGGSASSRRHRSSGSEDQRAGINFEPK